MSIIIHKTELKMQNTVLKLNKDKFTFTLQDLVIKRDIQYILYVWLRVPIILIKKDIGAAALSKELVYSTYTLFLYKNV